MIAVIFEVEVAAGKQDDYLQSASDLRPLLEGVDGFISIERFQSLSQPGKVLSLSFWRDEMAVEVWRNEFAHRCAQSQGRASTFQHYRLRVAEVIRDYGLDTRAQAPQDSQQIHA
ncbi:hypothetical protein VST7929_00946 [Vibrio stylophorae]|uniref:ABM domain-containing protein n=1 Tax=Vibrio stylophorae TaxID=659351 RepID=A0ABM8ZS19_9VIBR|nr:antibiotic biosynthesis monooxygenase [Vibrio stylophorae]CAH0533093.1 hypothetical protein VST7929_00946 [Vibrio stylophorae]